MTMAFIDLGAQQARLRPALDVAIARVLDHGAFIMGPEVAALEGQLCAASGASSAISCANGTDALGMVLMAWGIGAGDAVFVPAFTFVATAEVVAWVGATPIFVDVDEDSFTLDPDSLKAAVAEAQNLGLRPKAVIPVDLYGLPADYAAIDAIARENEMKVLADAAQSYGAAREGQKVGTFGDATGLSFFPSKPLGCYGDGGAILTSDAELAATLKSIRVHGQGTHKYDNVRIGLNARLDTLQAAVLLEKMKIFDEEIIARNRVAKRYSELLDGHVAVPPVPEGVTSVWAQYTVRVPRRDQVQAACKAAGIPTMVYYPIPLNQQTGYRHYPVAPGGVPNSERLAADVLSLPMHPYLDDDAIGRVSEVLISACNT
ncbi:aminotransferase DegT [Agaricicola taiwanensis]|uniref:Aminotransferase DegT n=1 Tax=Agaricicola taiwanensis TaxID=591372 RepID=A0A8J2VNJ7_9RHOB|nr:DegT/DnrJ/EryC1/StrS family aminotransferase [Agaricicola taiwanensis]GGE34934.1 aminotransferase DegT [Agaricicola taiwanensis]